MKQKLIPRYKTGSAGVLQEGNKLYVKKVPLSEVLSVNLNDRNIYLEELGKAIPMKEAFEKYPNALVYMDINTGELAKNSDMEKYGYYEVEDIKNKSIVNTIMNINRKEFTKLIEKITPREYTAAQNTIYDLILAPIYRKTYDLSGVKIPPKVYDSRHLSPELYSFLQDAIDKKWNPEDRRQYFENHPQDTIKKTFVGRLNGQQQSDYEKYFGNSYTGPLVKGFTKSMFGPGIDQAQATFGAFDIQYLPDKAIITDSWDFQGRGNFGYNSLMNIIRSLAETYGSQESSNVNPTRIFKGIIQYKQD